MNIQYNVVVIGLLLLAIIFVPFVPHDSMESCDALSDECDDAIGYVSLYTKYFK
jgi:acyl-CoA synthetase (AMP-forming)/AMP-acid ligase II